MLSFKSMQILIPILASLQLVLSTPTPQEQSSSPNDTSDKEQNENGNPEIKIGPLGKPPSQKVGILPEVSNGVYKPTAASSLTPEASSANWAYTHIDDKQPLEGCSYTAEEPYIKVILDRNIYITAADGSFTGASVGGASDWELWSKWVFYKGGSDTYTFWLSEIDQEKNKPKSNPFAMCNITRPNPETKSCTTFVLGQNATAFNEETLKCQAAGGSGSSSNNNNNNNSNNNDNNSNATPSTSSAIPQTNPSQTPDQPPAQTSDDGTDSSGASNA